MAKPWESTLQAMDSAIHARYALELTRNGSWLPKLPIRMFYPEASEPYFNDHPYLPFYLVGKFMRAFGANAWGARFLPSLFGVASLGAVMAIAKKLSGFQAAALCGVSVLIAPLIIQFTARFQLDPFLVFFTLLSFYFVLEKKYWSAGIASGLAVCFKSPVGWLILPTVFCFEFFTFRFLKVLIPAIVLPLLLWVSANLISHEPLLQDYWTRQVLGTALGGRHLSNHSDWLTGYQVLKANLMLPLLILLIGFVYSRVKKQEFAFSYERKFIAVGFAIFWFIISLMRFKFPHYFMPGVPLGILSVICFLPPSFLDSFRFINRPLWILAPTIAIGLLILPIKTCPESFPALRYFTPIIQNVGSEQDKILFIENTQPYGSAGDYFVETAFYTGKLFYSAICKSADARLTALQPEWVITSGATPFDCLDRKIKSQYSSIWKFGNMYLLSKIAPSKGEEFDFTPQARDLEAPLDGVAAPLPRNIFNQFN